MIAAGESCRPARALSSSTLRLPMPWDYCPPSFAGSPHLPEGKIIKMRFGLEDGSELTPEEVGPVVRRHPRADSSDRSQRRAEAASSFSFQQAQVASRKG